MTETIVAVGTRKGLWLARSDDRQAWRLEGPHFLMSEVASVAVDTRAGRSTVLAGVKHWHWGPTVQSSVDGGRTWTESPERVLAFPADTDTALERVWQLTPDPNDDDVVWAGVEPHALFRSSDRGEHYELVRGLWDHPHRPHWEPGFGGGAVHTVILEPGHPERLLVAMSAGGVYRSADGGASWAPSNPGISAYFMPGNEYPEYGQCVHKVARGVDGTCYAQNHRGVYRSDDGGATWVSIADGLPTDFGFAILAHPTRPGTVWNIPVANDGERIPPGARLQVQRSDDGGRTWRMQATGLPAESYTCVLRDAAALDTADPVGVYFGTRNGDVFVSVDEGETFARIATQLPDVLAVRAARLP
ncbi:sialidase family protein [Intrasporangium sp.]|uniref:WD40/YVTN/BNR-like repeat-containing protein n=1 Tax=Intrasporangium sp. TaxID=1925024 RepID=UPI00322178BF